LQEGEFMSKFVFLASVVAVAAISAACAETGGQTNPGASLFTAPSSLTASSTDAEVSAPAARGGGGGGGKPGGGKGGTGSTGGSGSLALVMVTDVGTSGTSLGDRVTFTVSTTATEYPWVTVKCSQNGTPVYQQSNGIFPTSLGVNFTLGPTPLWQSGGADCTATLHVSSGPVLGSLSFQALG
jgi:hypothetical protein